MKELLEKPITFLPLDNNTKKKLLESQIDTIHQICKYSRMELSNELGLTNDQINHIIIGLQLQGLDLKPNHAKKNNKLEVLLQKG